MTNMKTIRENGFTLIECIVGLALSTLVLSVIWMIFSATAHRGAKTSQKLDGLQGAIALVQQFEHDCNRMYIDNEHQFKLTKNEYLTIEFFIFSNKKSDFNKHVFAVQKIRYYFLKDRHLVYRQIDEEQKRRFKGCFEDFFISRANSNSSTVNYLITSVSNDFFEQQKEKQKLPDRVIFQGSIHLPEEKTTINQSTQPNQNAQQDQNTQQNQNTDNAYVYWHKVPVFIEG